MRFSKPAFVESVEKTGDFSVQFNLKESGIPASTASSGDSLSGVYMMLISTSFEAVDDPVTFTFNPPVSLGAYTVAETDPNGYWELWERRGLGTHFA